MANVYGYVRVSTRDQNEDRQMIALQELNILEKNIYMDKQSGKDFDRPNVIKKDVSNMRELQSLANAIVGQCSNDEMKEELQKIADELRFSDPVTSEESAPLEKELLGQLKEIQKAMVDDDVEAVRALSKRLLVCVMEKNRVCKLSK